MRLEVREKGLEVRVERLGVREKGLEVRGQTTNTQHLPHQQPTLTANPNLREKMGRLLSLGRVRRPAVEVLWRLCVPGTGRRPRPSARRVYAAIGIRWVCVVLSAQDFLRFITLAVLQNNEQKLY